MSVGQSKAIRARQGKMITWILKSRSKVQSIKERMDAKRGLAKYRVGQIRRGNP